MSEVFFHLGAHKTASSFFQTHLKRNREELAKQNWKFVYVKQDLPKVYLEIVKLRNGKRLPPELSKAFDKFFSDVRTSSENTLISSEAFLGTMNIRMAKGVLYEQHAAMLDRLKASLQGRDTTLGFCIRDFGSFLESSYSQLVFEGATMSFKDYIAHVTPGELSWVRIIAKMVETFGANNVRIWTFEDFEKNPAAAFKAVLSSTSIDARPLHLADDSPRNAAIPPDTLDVARAWNSVLKEQGVARLENMALRERMRQLLSETPRTAEIKRPILRPGLKAELSAHYASELAEIRKRWPGIILRLEFGLEK